LLSFWLNLRSETFNDLLRLRLRDAYKFQRKFDYLSEPISIIISEILSLDYRNFKNALVF